MPLRQPELELPDGQLDPAVVYQIFFSPELQTHVVGQTNLYASQQKVKAAADLMAARRAAESAGEPSPPSPLKPREWKEINRAKLMKYVAIIIYMGVISLGCVREYWSDKSTAHHKKMGHSGMPEII